MIIPTWDNYTDRILKDEAVAPYQSSIAVDSGFEEGSFQGVKLANGSITYKKIGSVLADQILTSTLTTQVNVGTASGSAYVRLDGVNNRIIINDGTTDRILIGYQLGGF
jgi:hypothetical protein